LRPALRELHELAASRQRSGRGPEDRILVVGLRLAQEVIAVGVLGIDARVVHTRLRRHADEDVRCGPACYAPLVSGHGASLAPSRPNPTVKTSMLAALAADAATSDALQV